MNPQTEWKRMPAAHGDLVETFFFYIFSRLRIKTQIVDPRVEHLQTLVQFQLNTLFTQHALT